MTEEIKGRVSVMIPARNEEANIERAVRSVAAQRGVREIIVVDDQSSDRTGAILENLKGEFPSLRTIRIESLPAGWMGKSHALASAARMAKGDWFLFTDADTGHRPESLSTLVARAEHEGADLLSLSPGQRVPTWWEKAVIPLIFAGLARRFKFEEVSDPRSNVAAANGQYILIRREIYQQSGGHEAVRGDVLDDVALARRVKSLGGHILFLPGAAWAETRMYRTFHEMWQGWTKNLYALCGGKMTNIVDEVARTFLLDFLPAAALASFISLFILELWTPDLSMWISMGAFVSLSAVSGRLWSYRRELGRLGLDSRAAKYLFLGSPMYAVLLLNSARAHARGRVTWKGREYETRNSTMGEE
ncbi:MAG TPA: glycosyltransferase family 2 protein [Terriglobia bacterium]|nr:glycosyltransferase family 2 protein [Terriglobia bacterium]